MKQNAVVISLAICGALGGSAGAFAQYTGPTPTKAPVYSGPNSIPLMTAKQVIDSGMDDQHARIQGRLVSHNGGKHYTFADETGRLTAKIANKRFRPGQPVSAEQRVELVGEIDKDFNKIEFEVDEIRLLP